MSNVLIFGGLFGVVFATVVMLFVVFFVVAAVKVATHYSRNNNAPVRTVEARVVNQRGDRSGEGTSYHVTFELPTGERVELMMTGPQYGQIAAGDCGTLTCQGTRFKGFERMLQDT